MGKRKNDTLSPKKATRKMRDVCWVGTEGRTEMDYLQMDVFSDRQMVVRFPSPGHSNKTNPEQVVRRFKKAMSRCDFRKGDEAWLVVDTDSWEDGDRKALNAWEKSDVRHHLAISNPKFELFLVMHFEKGNGCTTSRAVDIALKKYMPAYRKRLQSSEFGESQVRTAIANAAEKRQLCEDAWPALGMTDAYKLADRILGPEGASR